MSFWMPGMTLESIEKIAIEQAYRFYRENKTQTANSLGISIRTLDSKLEIYEQRKRENDETNERLRKEREAFIQRSKGSQTPIEFVHSSHSGPRVEPAATVTTQSKMPVPERTQVQEVLPRQASPAGHKRARS